MRQANKSLARSDLEPSSINNHQPRIKTTALSNFQISKLRPHNLTIITITMANGGSIIIGLIITAIASVIAWFLSPKGETQTIWRSSLILSFASCYIMWAITFLAQWHPLIVPRRGDLRPEYARHMSGY